MIHLNRRKNRVSTLMVWGLFNTEDNSQVKTGSLPFSHYPYTLRAGQILGEGGRVFARFVADKRAGESEGFCHANWAVSDRRLLAIHFSG